MDSREEDAEERGGGGTMNPYSHAVCLGSRDNAANSAGSSGVKKAPLSADFPSRPRRFRY